MEHYGHRLTYPHDGCLNNSYSNTSNSTTNSTANHFHSYSSTNNTANHLHRNSTTNNTANHLHRNSTTNNTANNTFNNVHQHRNNTAIVSANNNNNNNNNYCNNSNNTYNNNNSNNTNNNNITTNIIIQNITNEFSNNLSIAKKSTKVNLSPPQTGSSGSEAFTDVNSLCNFIQHTEFSQTGKKGTPVRNVGYNIDRYEKLTKDDMLLIVEFFKVPVLKSASKADLIVAVVAHYKNVLQSLTAVQIRKVLTVTICGTIPRQLDKDGLIKLTIETGFYK